MLELRSWVSDCLPRVFTRVRSFQLVQLVQCDRVTRVAAGAAKDQLFKSPCCALLWLSSRGSGACAAFVLLGADVGFTMLRGLG